MVKGKVGIRDRAIIEVFYALGVRPNELANIDIRHVDAKKLIITVRKGKGGYDITVPIVQRTIDALNDYLENVRPELATLESGDALFLGMTGKRILSSKLTVLVGDYVRRSGVAEYGACHILIYATGTHMLENGADILVVQEQLGHEDISSTQLYDLVSIKHLKKVHANTHPFSNKRSPQ